MTRRAFLVAVIAVVLVFAAVVGAAYVRSAQERARPGAEIRIELLSPSPSPSPPLDLDPLMTEPMRV